MVLLVANSIYFTQEDLDAFRALGFELRFLPGKDEQPYPDEDFSDVDAVVCFRFFCCNDISRFPALKYIHTTSAGLDHMPLDEIRRRAIRLDNARGVYSIPMAEFALCGVLQLYKRTEWFRRNRETHTWKITRSLRELPGKSVCVLGTGSIGTEVAKRFSAMGCRVTGLCRHPSPTPGFDEVRSVSELDAVLPETDIAVLALPYSAETHHLFDARRISLMKRGGVLVNIARGRIVDTEALRTALADGTLSGAVIDVFETEPLPADSPLWETENLILTPHNSFASEANNRRMFELICNDLKKWLENA